MRVPAVQFYETCHGCHESCAALPTDPDPRRPHTHLQVVATLLTALVLQRAVPLTCLARSGAEWPSCCLALARTAARQYEGLSAAETAKRV